MVFAADDVARRIVDNLGTVETLALQKLLYYSQAWHLAITGDKLFSDSIRAYRYGPVVEAVRRQHEGKISVSEWPTGDADRIDDSARRVIDLVCHEYGSMSGWGLAQKTHAEAPWIQARAGAPDDASGRRPIDTAVMTQCFREGTLAGRRASDLAVGDLFITSHERFGGAGAHAVADGRDYSDVIGRAASEVPERGALDHLVYPTSASRVRPARVR